MDSKDRPTKGPGEPVDIGLEPMLTDADAIAVTPY